MRIASQVWRSGGPSARRWASNPTVRSPRCCAAPTASRRRPPPRRPRPSWRKRWRSLAFAAEEAERLMPSLYSMSSVLATPTRPAACRARAAPAADLFRDPHPLRTAAGAIAPPDHRRGPALGRCRVARSAAVLMDRLERTRLMLLFTHRPSLETEQFATGSHQPLRPGGPPSASPTDQTARGLLQSRLGRSAAEIAFNRILERASGNPLFIEEIVRGLDRSRRPGARRFALAGQSDDRATPTSRQAFRRCCWRGSTGCRNDVRRLAQEAAVIGPRFDAALLSATATDPRAVTRGSNSCATPRSSRRSGCGLDVAASLSVHADHAAGRDLSKPPAAATHRNYTAGSVPPSKPAVWAMLPSGSRISSLLGHHFSLSAEQAERRAVTCVRPAIGPARSTPTMTRSVSISRRWRPYC